MRTSRLILASAAAAALTFSAAPAMAAPGGNGNGNGGGNECPTNWTLGAISDLPNGVGQQVLDDLAELDKNGDGDLCANTKTEWLGGFPPPWRLPAVVPGNGHSQVAPLADLLGKRQSDRVFVFKDNHKGKAVNA